MAIPHSNDSIPLQLEAGDVGKDLPETHPSFFFSSSNFKSGAWGSSCPMFLAPFIQWHKIYNLEYFAVEFSVGAK